MAGRIQLNDLSKEKREKIVLHLTFTPGVNDNDKKNVEERKKNKGKEKSFLQAPKLPLRMYIVNPEKTYIDVPFGYYKVLTGIQPNCDIQFPQRDVELFGTTRPHQVSVIDEAIVALDKRGAVTIGVYPGFGKTFIGAYLSCLKKYVTCILCTLTPLIPQWKSTYETNTSCKVGIVGEDNDLHLCDVIICMKGRVHLLSQEIIDSVGMLIIDEAHLFCTAGAIVPLLTFHPRYVVAETATLSRQSDGMEQMIQSIVGFHQIKRNYSVTMKVKLIRTKIVPEVVKNEKTGMTDYSVMTASILFNEDRNKLIVKLVKENLDKSILILTSMVKHAIQLSNTLNEEGVTSDYLAGKKKSFDSKAKVLVGNKQKVGTGFDQRSSAEDPLDVIPFNLVIFCSSYKNTDSLEQNVGRGMRCDDPNFIYLLDKHPIYTKHWKGCREWFESVNTRFVV